MGRERFYGRGVETGDVEREQRAAVADAERLQERKFVRDAGMVLPFARHIEFGGKVLAPVVRADIFVERGFEAGEIFRRHVDARRLRVAAELFNVFRARFERLENVHALHAARAAAEHIAAAYEEQRGTGKLLRNAGGDDAHESRVPIFRGEHDDVAVRPLFADLLHRLRVQFVAGALAFPVVEVEFFRKRGDRLLVLRGEERERGVRVPHSARGVDAGRDGERERLRRDLGRLAEQRRERGAGALFNAFQPLRDDVAVLVRERHAVRHRGERGEIDEFKRLIADERAGEFERHARAAQIIVRIFVFEFGIDRDAVGQAVGQLVVIGHDDVCALLLRVLHFVRVGNAAVHRHDEVGQKFVENLIERGDAHAVPLRALGNVEIGFDAEHPHGAGEHRKRADAVRVVVAEQRDAPLLVARLREQFLRLPHPLHEEGREEVTARGIEEGAHFALRRHAARVEKARRRLGNAERRGARPDRGELLRGKFKFAHKFFHDSFCPSVYPFSAKEKHPCGKSAQKSAKTAGTFPPSLFAINVILLRVRRVSCRHSARASP